MEKLKRYKKYKPSGVEWIGEIPEHWEVRKLSRSFQTIGSGTTPTVDKRNYYDEATINWVNTGDLNDALLTQCNKKITESALNDYSSLKVFPAGSLVMAMYGATIGKLSILGIPACTNQACCVLTRSLFFDNKYLFYWLMANKPHIISMAYGGGQPNISQELVRSLRVSSPPINEQKAIANYLDEKTALIDETIAKKQRLIELLQEERTALINKAVTRGLDDTVPLKDSGVEWLGMIPEHWEVKKLKHLITKIGSGVTPKGGAEVYQTTGIPLLRSQNVYFDGLRLDDVAYISEEIHESMSGTHVKTGDVLLNITGASIGRCYYAEDWLGEANVNQHVCIIRPGKRLTTKYLYFVLASSLGQGQIDRLQNGANREGLNFEQTKNFVIPTPTVEEQQYIVSTLSQKTLEIDETIKKERFSINLLQEYRTALINEVVTGKRCVL